MIFLHFFLPFSFEEEEKATCPKKSGGAEEPIWLLDLISIEERDMEIDSTGMLGYWAFTFFSP